MVYTPRPEYLTAAEQVAQALRTAITTGMLPTGTPIRQEELATQHQVSRMPVREALRQLESEGLITIYPNRGAFVATLNASDVQEIYDIRALLEGEALRRAWPVLTPALFQQAAGILDQLDTATESTVWSMLDEQFHITLYTPAHRPRLLDLITTLRRQVNHLYYLSHSPSTYHSSRQKEHRHILAACRAGHLTDAVGALEDHLRGSAAIVVAAHQKHSTS